MPSLQAVKQTVTDSKQANAARIKSEIRFPQRRRGVAVSMAIANIKP